MDKKELEKLGLKIETLENEMHTITSGAVQRAEAFTADESKKLGELKAAHAGLVEVMRAAKAHGSDEETVKPNTDTTIQERAIKAQKLPHVGTTPAQKERDEKPFRSFGEQMRAIAIAGNGGHRDERLDKVLRIQEEQRAASGMGENTPSDGGFLVQKDFSDSLIAQMYETSKLVKYCKQIPISANSDSIEIPALDETSRANGSRLGGITVYWGNEADSPTATKPKFRTISMKLLKMFAAGYVTEELQQDAAALGAFLSDCFVNEMGFVMDDMILRGNGAGRPLGVLDSNNGALVTATKVSQQTADTFNFQNALAMRVRMWPGGLANARWLVNQELWGQIPQFTLLGGTSSPGIFLPPGTGGIANNAPGGTLLGHPIEVLEQCSAIGDLGDVVLADLSQYLVIKKGDLQAQSSIHVRFLYGENTYRFMQRWNGQPIWKTAPTPYKGANSYSPYVTLEAR